MYSSEIKYKTIYYTRMPIVTCKSCQLVIKKDETAGNIVDFYNINLNMIHIKDHPRLADAADLDDSFGPCIHWNVLIPLSNLMSSCRYLIGHDIAA